MRSHAIVARLAVLAALAAPSAYAPQAHAQTSVPAPTPLPMPAPVPMPAPGGPALASDTVVGRVDDSDIRLSEVSDAGQQLPEEMRGMPSNMLFPMLLDQVIDRR